MSEFQAHSLWQPQTSERACLENTSAETLQQMILGFLMTTTGLPWEVRVEHVPVEVGDQDLSVLKVRAMVSMAVPKDRIGSEPDYKVELPKIDA